MSTLPTSVDAGWRFDHSYAELPEMFYSRLDPAPASAPRLVVFNEALAISLGLDAQALNGADGAEVFAGNRLPEGARPLAQAYAGHQFGYFTMLGDGRALLLGEQMTPQGERFDIQLKGAGRTPYSRSGDGRAALGPMLREYIISEAMHALGIPTTRSLAVAVTGDPVYRETALTGAVLTRVAASHLRVGTFQYAAGRGELANLRILADYAIQRHFSHIDQTGNDRYLAFYREVIRRQAALVAKWQLVGFIHGVMNTDNMAISGETIDYGPCAFMDVYDPETVFSSIDRHGRYRYGNQPTIAAWNLARFAETLLPLLHDDQEQAVEIAQQELETFQQLYRRHWLDGMRAKLGLAGEHEADEALVTDLLDMMKNHRADYTNTFLDLTFGRWEQMSMHGSGAFKTWLERWQARQAQGVEQAADQQKQEHEQPAGQQDSRLAKNDPQALMLENNPAVIPRNHRVEEALDAAVSQGDYEPMMRLLDVLSRPYAHDADQAAYAVPPEPSDCGYKTFCGT